MSAVVTRDDCVLAYASRQGATGSHICSKPHGARDATTPTVRPRATGEPEVAALVPSVADSSNIPEGNRLVRTYPARFLLTPEGRCSSLLA